MSAIGENLEVLQKEIPSTVKLVVVSKMQPVESILEVYGAGHRRFGENRVQDLIIKQPLLPGDIEWHFIGHLQTNKVKFIATFVAMIESVDSLKLLREIDKEALRNNRIIDCLLEMYIAKEESKYGLDLEEARELLLSDEFAGFRNIRINGVMGMATFTDDTERVRKEFRTLKTYFDILKKEYFRTKPEFCELSMGMSGDYPIAMEEGSTLVRIGSKIFRK